MDFLNQDVADVIWKTRLHRGVHAYHERYTQRLSRLVKTLNIVLSAFLLCLLFSDITPLSTSIPWFGGLTFSKLLISIFALALFIPNVLMEVFAVNSRWLEHRLAITNYSDLLDLFAKGYSVDQSAQARRKLLDLLKQRYTLLTMSGPALTDQEFHAGEISYRRFLANRLAREENPLGWLWQIRKAAQEKVKHWEELQKTDWQRTLEKRLHQLGEGEAEQSNRQERLRAIEVKERLAREFPNSSEVASMSALPLKPSEIDKTTQEGSPLQESSETLKVVVAQSEGRGELGMPTSNSPDIPREKEIQEDPLDALTERLQEQTGSRKEMG